MSCTAFNNLLKQLCSELAAVFPEHAKLQVAERALDDVISVNAKLPMQKFVEVIGPSAGKLTARDPSLFTGLSLYGIDFGELWATEDVSDATWDAMWRYLSTLWTLATVCSSLPPELLDSIEKISEEVAADLDDGEQPDIGKMMTKMMTHMGPLLAGFGGFGATPPYKPRGPTKALPAPTGNAGAPATAPMKSKTNRPAGRK